jgi:hypothetical protein
MEPTQLPRCPHRHCGTQWHWLPTPTCGGSHLPKDEAKSQARHHSEMSQAQHPVDLLRLRHVLVNGTGPGRNLCSSAAEAVAYPILADGAEAFARLVLLAAAIPFKWVRRSNV